MKPAVSRCLIAALMCCGALAPALFCQTPSPQSQPAAAPAQGGDAATVSTGDQFPALRANADSLRTAYDELSTKDTPEIDALMRTKRCQIKRIGGLIDRELSLFGQWAEAELKYWDSWGADEQERVDKQKVTLATLETEQKRTSDYIDSQKQDREAMEKKRGELEKYGKRTLEIRNEIDSIIREIQDSESRLTNAQEQFDDLTIKINNMKASITARLVEIRQNRATVDSIRLQRIAELEQKRAAANEICNTKQPVTKAAPASKPETK